MKLLGVMPSRGSSRPAIKSSFLAFPKPFVFGVATSAYQIEAVLMMAQQVVKILLPAAGGSQHARPQAFHLG